MYAGTTLTPISGRLLGAHQKIDRLARSALSELLPETLTFPTSKQILHFEGVNGPDAIKRKSPAQDEPWHYFMPFDPSDRQLLRLIADHYASLVEALHLHDDVRAAFQAAWLAHALVDGMTPAHHYPYEERLSELRGGEGKASRTSIKTKLLMPGETRRDQMSNNWKMWGPRGLLTMHGMFEFGIASIITPMRSQPLTPSPEAIAEAQKLGLTEFFRRRAQAVASLDLYEQYGHRGWTPRLARVVRRQLVPMIVEVVAAAWYMAAMDAERSRT